MRFCSEGIETKVGILVEPDNAGGGRSRSQKPEGTWFGMIVGIHIRAASVAHVHWLMGSVGYRGQ